MSDFFNEAYRRARGKFTTEQWLALSPQQITDAIYRAMREIDAASAARAASTSRNRDRSDRMRPGDEYDDL